MDMTRRKLMEALVKTAESKYILTEHGLKNVLTEDTIRKCIEQANIDILLRRDCIEAALNGGKKLLALLIMQNRVDLMVKFVESDQSSDYKSGHLDSRLPFEQQTLTRILSDSDAIFNIQRYQWEVIAPYFQNGRPHRTYQSDVITPYIHSKWIGGGGFGDVYEVTLPNTHHGFELQGGDQVTIVRKQLRSEGNVQEVNNQFSNEQRILVLLKSLRHENIIELLASYTVLNDPPEHNFLFPRADTTLAKVLHDKGRDALNIFFPSEHVLQQQIYGLSSAIDNLHQYFSDEYDVELIGCHYDLAPRNILIRHSRLLLADFGLSRLRPETSKSIFAAGKGDYLAPECEPLQNGTFSRGIMGRASDIWSLGCILLEIFIYNSQPKNKAQAVEKFKKERRITLWDGEYKAYPFHSHGKPNQAVTRVLDSLTAQSKNTQRKHLSLIRDMLAYDPDKRPLASMITVHIFTQAQETLVRIVCEAFETLKRVWESRRDNTPLEVERMRFIFWGWGAGLIEDYPSSRVPTPFSNNPLREWLWSSRQIFDQVHKVLLDVLLQLELITADDETNKSNSLPEVVWRPLQILTDRLWALPPRPLVRIMNSLLENEILRTDDSYALYLYGSSERKNIALLSTIKRMTAKIHEDDHTARKKLLLKDHQIPISVKLGIHRFGTINDIDDAEKLVLVEEMPFSDAWLGHNNGEELYGRADALAELLNNPEILDCFRVLQCMGYFLDFHHSAISLVYEFPTRFPQSLKPLDLKRLISGCQRPNLGSLFDLAKILVRCVLTFHKTGWLHKNISSLNILFFDKELSQIYSAPTKIPKENSQLVAADRDEKSMLPSTSQIEKKKPQKRSLNPFSKRGQSKKSDSQSSVSTSKIASSASSIMDPQGLNTDAHSLRGFSGVAESIDVSHALQQPYIVGLDHSRPDVEDTFTSGPSSEQSQKPYQHPNHRGSQRTQRYYKEYDYYSLGVVLLELALWKPIEVIVQSTSKDRLPENTIPDWLLEVVPQLGSTMGAVYHDAVKACLSRELTGSDAGPRPAELFEDLVVNKIEQCYA